MEAELEVTHFAGAPISIGPLVRQLCGWCGYRLIDVDRRLIAVPIGQDPEPLLWEYGALVAVRGPMSTVVEHEISQPLPLNACSFEALMPKTEPEPEPDPREADPCAFCTCHTATECRERECDKTTCPG